jgi:hypothetical protein
MDLLDAAGHYPASRWCLTATGTDGTAVAHACLRGPRTLDTILQAAGANRAWTAADLAAALGTTLEPVTKGACDHAHAGPGYRPSRKLRHLIAARNARCTAYGCGRPATACDYDHTTPWDKRRHHLRMQPRPAVQAITTHVVWGPGTGAAHVVRCAVRQLAS